MSRIQSAFDYCENIAKSHYENFPIGWFVPKSARRYLYAIYAFARTADDYADEAAYAGEAREKLEEHEKNLNDALMGRSDQPLFIAVAETLEKTGIPAKLLKDLLVAFRMDTQKSRYATYEELETYCVYSANPIGRIVLMLFGFHDKHLLQLSDKICTGIQLVNHWQDIGVDLKKDRVYLPEEDLKKFHYSYEDLFAHKINDAFRSLMRFQISRTRSLFEEGKSLLTEIGRSDRRLRWQVSLMWWGPMRILEKIEDADYDVFRKRPKLTKGELAKIFLSRSLYPRR